MFAPNILDREPGHTPVHELRRSLRAKLHNIIGAKKARQEFLKLLQEMQNPQRPVPSSALVHVSKGELPQLLQALRDIQWGIVEGTRPMLPDPLRSVQEKRPLIEYIHGPTGFEFNESIISVGTLEAVANIVDVLGRRA